MPSSGAATWRSCSSARRNCFLRLTRAVATSSIPPTAGASWAASVTSKIGGVSMSTNVSSACRLANTS